MRPAYVDETPPPVDVRILPEQKHLAAVVRRIHSSCRAYSLFDLATFFLSKPEFACVRLEARDGAMLRQCRSCQTVAVEAGVLQSHILNRHLDDFFTREETLADPPSGQFVCVARCGLSGELLGPPNHHSYAERMMEVYRSRYSHMTLDQYKSRIETLRDPQLIEKWKEESRKQVVYRLKDSPAGEGKTLRRQDAVAWFQEKLAVSLIHETHRLIVPAKVALEAGDPALVRLVREIWSKESRFPIGFSFALRAAFRHMHLHVFKAGRGVSFVTGILPSPLDPAFVIPSIRNVLLHLTNHPGTGREELLKVLSPEAGPDTPQSREVLSDLGWLIEKGHIIEFQDGALAVPLRSAGESPVASGRPAASAPPPDKPETSG